VFRIDRETRVPLKFQLQRELRHAIQTGRLKVGALLPSSWALAADLGCLATSSSRPPSNCGRKGMSTRTMGRPRAWPGVERSTGNRRRWRLRRSLHATIFRPGVPDLSLFPRRAWLAAVRAHLPRSRTRHSTTPILVEQRPRGGHW